MALGFAKSSGDSFLPSFRFNAVSGDVVIAGSTKNPDGQTWDKFEHEVSLPAKFIFDFANLEVGWVQFAATGPSFAMVKVGERMPERPNPEHKQGFRITLYNKEHGLVTFSNSSNTVADPMDTLHDAYLRDEKANPGKVPVVEFKGVKKIQIKTKEGSKTYKQPDWAIVQWVARPEAMDDKKIEEVEEPSTSDDDFT
jgi:hypothetical protein